MNEIAAQIEVFLLENRHWIPSAEICARFGLRDDRALRGLGKNPGLCTKFSISGDKGFKHVRYATDAEWDRFEHRLHNHAVSELTHLRDLRRLRQSYTVSRPPVVFEKTTGQALLIA